MKAEEAFYGLSMSCVSYIFLLLMCQMVPMYAAVLGSCAVCIYFDLCEYYDYCNDKIFTPYYIFGWWSLGIVLAIATLLITRSF